MNDGAPRLRFGEAPPLALYAHFPWCVSRCPYCDFNSHALRARLPGDEYVDALLADLRARAPRVAGRPLVSIFLGGGTPSLFSAAQIGRFLDGVRDTLAVAEDAEITLEANPGTVEQERFAGYRAAGVNRLSLGVQSFDDTLLRRIGRIHDAGQALRAVEQARSAGFTRLNVDLMYALPGQSPAQALADVDRACRLDPGHVSHYQLTVEPGTAFHRHPPTLPDDEAAAAMQAAAARHLAAAGYRQYEVSALARPGHRCRHNLNYWQFGDYLGIGAGAHGKLTDVAGGFIEREARVSAPRRYLAAPAAPGTRRRLDAGDVLFEFMLNALRQPLGFGEALLAARTGLPVAWVAPRLQQAEARGLLARNGPWWRPTAQGRRFLNDLQALFLAA